MPTAIWIVSAAALLVLSRLGKFNLGGNQYINPPVLLLAAVSGWIFIYAIASLLSKVPVICRPLVHIGQNTLPIVLFHFLCFKLVNLAGILCDGSPMYCMAAFPVYYYGGIWWLAYTVVGVAIPVLGNDVWQKIKAKTVLRFMPKRS